MNGVEFATTAYNFGVPVHVLHCQPSQHAQKCTEEERMAFVLWDNRKMTYLLLCNHC